MKKEVLKSLKKHALTSSKEAGKVFNPFFQSIAETAFQKLEEDERIVQMLEKPLAETLDANILIGILFKVSKRILIADMNIQREMGKLSGNTEEEQYQDYVWGYLMQPDYLQKLFHQYPVWEENLFCVTDFFIRNIKEVVQHLDKDCSRLNAELFSNCPFDKIRHIGGSGSDTHCENRIVYRIELNNGECLYHKPRVNTGVRFFNELYRQVCESLDILAYLNPVYMGTNYVWEKEAVYAECTNEQQVKNYFLRLGVILSICHLCHGGDMHYENIVASGEFPIIIDYETLVQLPPENLSSNVDLKNQIIGESVLPIGILPFYAERSQNFNADFSGLCGGGKQVMDLKVPTIENAGKSTMCIAYKYGETAEKNNRLRLNGEWIQPIDYRDELFEGYKTCYVFILEHREKLLQLLKLMEGAVFRQLLRNTQEYQMILDLSYHPEFMRQSERRRKFLEDALNIPIFKDRQNIVKQEIEDMLRGDIPYFQFEMSTGAVLNSKGEPIETSFGKKGIQFLKEQILSRSEKDLNLQKQWIEASLMYAQVENLKQFYPKKLPELPGNEEIIEMCQRIADRIYADAIHKSGRVLWMNTHIMTTGVDKRHTYFMELSDRYLYDGTMGMAVFMAAFLKLQPTHKISEIYEKIIEDLFRYTDTERQENGPATGAFLGEGSIAYGYQLLFRMTGEERFLTYAYKHCCKVAIDLYKDCQYDLVGGNAGAILTFLNMYDLSEQPEYLVFARQAGDFLIAHAVPTKTGVGWKNISNDGLLGGFAHGCAGIMYALARLASYVNEEKYLDTAYRAFTYERTMNQPEHGGWRDYRSEKPFYMKDFKWCHGVAGVVLGWSLAAQYFDEKRKNQIYQEISKVIQSYPEILLKEELGLCHGNFGNIIIGQLTKVDAWQKSVTQNQKASFSVLKKVLSDEERNCILHEHYDYSLMTGWAGIGYGFLYHLPLGLPGILDVTCT